MKTTICTTILLTLTLMTPTPSLCYSYNRYPGNSQTFPLPATTAPPSLETVAEAVEEAVEQQQETADQYLEGLLNTLNAYGTPEQVQEKLEEQAEQALETQEQYGEYVKDVVDSLLDVINGSKNDTDDQVQEDLYAGNTTTAAPEDDEEDGVYATTVSFVVTTAEPDEEDQNEAVTTFAPATEKEDDSEDVTATVAPATTTDDDNEEKNDDEDVTTVAPTTDDGDHEDDNEDVTTMTPVSTTDDDDDNEKEEDDNVATTRAPVITTDDDDDNEDDKSGENTTPATIDRTLSTIDDDDDDDDDHSDQVTYAQAAITTTLATTTTDDDDKSDDDDDTTTAAAPTTTTAKPNMCPNGAGYNPHPTDCRRFVQCILNHKGVAVVAGVISCPPGLFWNQDAFVCDFQWNVDCQDDDEDDDDDDDDDATTTTTTTTTTTVATTKADTTPTTTVGTTKADTTIAAAPTTTVVPVPNMCTGCQFKHGVGYNPHPSDCTLFVQCRMSVEGVPVVAGVHSCAHGLYWNRVKLACDHQRNVQCLDDICRAGSLKQAKRSGATCRGFWDCRSGTSVAKCCAAGFSFNPVTQRCHYDPSCQDDCMSTHTVVDYECSGMRSVPGNRNAFEMKTGDNSWTRLTCPPTLAFTAYPCGCNEPLENPVPQPQCVPELYLPFETDASDYSGQSVKVENNGVHVKHGKAIFNGNSNLTINFFSNTFWGELVYIHVRYRLLQTSSDARQALVTNGDCGERPSLAMCASPGGVDFYAETKRSSLPANFTVPFANKQDDGWWKDALYRLDDGYLSGFVDTNMVLAPAAGPLESRQRALVIGGGGGCADLVGYIDELTLYRCRPHY